MASRDARLRVTLDDGAFAAGIRRAGETVQRVAGQMGGALKRELSAGVDAGIRSVTNLGGKLKGMLSMATGIGGAVGFEEMARHAIDAEAAAGGIAFKLRLLGENGATAANVLALAKANAHKYAITVDEATGAHSKLLEKTGEPLFSSQAIGSVALIQNTFRSSAESAAEVVAMFHKHLGASTDQITKEFGPALAGTLLKAGVQFDEFAMNADSIGAAMYRSHLKGADGLKQMIGLIGMAKEKGGDAQERISGAVRVFDKLGSKRQVMAFAKEAQLSSTMTKSLLAMHTPMERLQAMLANPEGFKKLEATFPAGRGGFGFFEGLTDAFKRGHDTFLANKGVKDQEHISAKVGKEAAAAGLREFNAALAKASTSTVTEADMQAEATKRMESTQRKLQLATNRMADALANEKFLGAVNKLADAAPRLADVFEKIVNFGVAHPGGAAAAVVGGTFAQGASAAVAVGVTKKLLTGAGKLFGSGAAAEGAGAAGAGLGLGAALAVGAAGAAGAAVGYALERAVVEPMMAKRSEHTRKVQETQANAEVALMGKSLARKQSALAQLHDLGGGSGRNEGDTLRKLRAQLEQQIAAIERAQQRQVASAEAVARANERVAKSTTARGVSPPPAAQPGALPPRES